MLSRLREWLRPKIDFHLDCIEVPRGATIVFRMLDEATQRQIETLATSLSLWGKERDIEMILVGRDTRIAVLTRRPERNDQGEDRKDER